MFEKFGLFIVLSICVFGMLGLNLLLNYPFIRYKLKRNMNYKYPFFFQVSKKGMKFILVSDLILFIIAFISMMFNSGLFGSVLICDSY